MFTSVNGYVPPSYVNGVSVEDVLDSIEKLDGTVEFIVLLEDWSTVAISGIKQ